MAAAGGGQVISIFSYASYDMHGIYMSYDMHDMIQKEAANIPTGLYGEKGELRRGSNQRPSACETCTLPLVLILGR